MIPKIIPLLLVWPRREAGAGEALHCQLAEILPGV